MQLDEVTIQRDGTQALGYSSVCSKSAVPTTRTTTRSSDGTKRTTTTTDPAAARRVEESDVACASTLTAPIQLYMLLSPGMPFGSA